MRRVHSNYKKLHMVVLSCYCLICSLLLLLSWYLLNMLVCSSIDPINLRTPNSLNVYRQDVRKWCATEGWTLPTPELSTVLSLWSDNKCKESLNAEWTSLASPAFNSTWNLWVSCCHLLWNPLILLNGAIQCLVQQGSTGLLFCPDTVGQYLAGAAVANQMHEKAYSQRNTW